MVMDKLIDFVLIENIIPVEFCDELVAEIANSSDWTKHSYHPGFKRPTVTQFPPTEFEFLDAEDKLSLRLMPYVERVMKSYNSYINEHNSFEGYDSETGVSTCTPIRFNRCKIHTLVEAHHDHIHELFGKGNKSIPSVSIVGLLNDEFTGGEFVMFKDTDMKLKKGDIIVFPSNYLYPHRVDKVKSGVRNSFVTWAF
jgi:hypothetical protein